MLFDRKFQLALRLLATCVLIMAARSWLHVDSPWNATLNSWWLFTVTVSILLIGLTFSTAWQAAGILSAALLAGYSSQLALTSPVWFQEIQFDRNGSERFLLFIAFQFAVTLTVLIWHRRRIPFARVARALSSRKTFLLIVLLLVSAFTAFTHFSSGNFPGAADRVLKSTAFLAINLFSAVAIFFCLPAGRLALVQQWAGERISLPGGADTGGRLDRLLPGATACWVLCASVLLCIFAFDRLPHVEDEVAYLFQARTFLGGGVFATAPALEKAFEYYLLSTSGGRWFAVTPPGWSMILAPGVAVGLPWLINPLLAGATVLMTHALVLKLAGRGLANAVVLLLAVSPWFLAMSASYMNHTASLALLIGSWLALAHARSRRSAWLALLAGLSMGLLFLTRSLDGLIAGVLTGVWILVFLRMNRGPLLVLAYCIGCIAMGSLLFPFNEALSGDYLTTPLNQYATDLWGEGSNRLGFGPDIGPPNQWGRLDMARGHDFYEAMANLQHNIYALNFELFGWPTGSLILAYTFLLWGRLRGLELQSLFFILIFMGAYALYWFNASFYIGPRYWYLAIVPLVLISIGGLQILQAHASRVTGLPDGAARVGVIVLLFVTIAMTTFLPWRGNMKYDGFRGYHADYRTLHQKLRGSRSLVFISKTSNSDFGSAMIFNEPDLAGSDVIFARDLGPESNVALAEAYPGRDLYFAKGRDIFNFPVKVRGPVPVESMKKE